MAGLGREAGCVEGSIAQIKDDLWEATKGRRKDTEIRLNRPLIRKTCARSEDALEALKTAKRREETAEVLAAVC